MNNLQITMHFLTKTPLLRCATMIDIALCIYSGCVLFKITNTAYHNYMLKVIYNDIPKITKYCDNKTNYLYLDDKKNYVDISINLYNCTPLISTLCILFLNDIMLIRCINSN